MADTWLNSLDMINQPLVDIAIATYNHEEFIGQAIDSVLAQQTDFDYRIIIGDDCSDDGTQQVVKDYAQKYPDLITTILYSEHRGLIHKERVGLRILEQCTAKYVTLLDGDDFWTKPSKLQKQVDFLEQHPDFAICFHNGVCFLEDASREPWNFCPPDQKEISTIEDLLVSNFIQTCSVMLRRSMIGKLPEWYNNSPIGDWLLYLIAAQHGRIGYLNEAMAAYRIRQGSFWYSQPSTYKLIETAKLLQEINEYLEYKYDREVKTSLCKYYDVLTNLFESQGNRIMARHFLVKHIRLGLSNYSFPSQLQLKTLLRLQTPGLYNLFRALRNFRD